MAMAAHDWMVITGAGPGIMEAGVEGAGPDNAFGVSIRLPFESPNALSGPAPSIPASMIPGPAPVITIHSRADIAAAKRRACS